MSTTTINTPNAARRVGCVLDFDNWVQSHTGARDGLDVLGIRKLLSDLGAPKPMLCANWLRPTEAAIFSALGFDTRVVGKNADPAVIEEAFKLADEGCTCIIIGSGDADYLAACKSLIARGVKIVLVAKQGSIAKAMARVSSAIYFLDRYLVSARPRQRRNGRRSGR